MCQFIISNVWHKITKSKRLVCWLVFFFFIAFNWYRTAANAKRLSGENEKNLPCFLIVFDTINNSNFRQFCSLCFNQTILMRIELSNGLILIIAICVSIKLNNFALSVWLTCTLMSYNLNIFLLPSIGRTLRRYQTHYSRIQNSNDPTHFANISISKW